jgi:insertion element IS1 protein InsB
MNNLRCPHWRLSHIKSNGHTHYGEQNYQRLDCQHQCVEASQRSNEKVRQVIKRLLLERLLVARRLPRHGRQPAEADER